MSKTLRELRLDKGLTLKQVAIAIGVTASAVSKWEVGDSRAWPVFIPKIAEFFGITPTEAREAIEESHRRAQQAAPA